MKKPVRILSLAMAMVLVLGMGTGCSSKSTDTNAATVSNTATASDYSYGEAGRETAEASPEVADGAAMQTADTAGNGGQSGSEIPNEKIVQYLTYDMETLNFDETLSGLEKLCTELGGYIQESSRSGEGINRQGLRDAYYVLRIPSGRLSDFRSGADGIGTVVRLSTNTENITEQYYDTESRLISLRTQEKRLLELMEKSETLTDVIALEQALADVTWEIESLTTSLRRYDALVDYSTVTVNINEVVQYSEPDTTPRTLPQRISTQFTSSVKGLITLGEDLLVLVVGGLPVILLLGIIFCVIFFPVRHQIRRRKSKQLPPPPSDQQAP